MNTKSCPCPRHDFYLPLYIDTPLLPLCVCFQAFWFPFSAATTHPISPASLSPCFLLPTTCSRLHGYSSQTSLPLPLPLQPLHSTRPAPRQSYPSSAWACVLFVPGSAASQGIKQDACLLRFASSLLTPCCSCSSFPSPLPHAQRQAGLLWGLTEEREEEGERSTVCMYLWREARTHRQAGKQQQQQGCASRWVVVHR